MPSGSLGRRAPTDWTHVQLYPLTALTTDERPTGVPMPIGVNWYVEFDDPVRGRDGRWRVAADGRLTQLRGGHCVCLLPSRHTGPSLTWRDARGWWRFYDQGAEGACVGFGLSRMMSLLNRRRYDARWLYRTAQLRDEWDNTPPAEGTSVRAGLDVLRLEGHRRVRWLRTYPTDLDEGVAANRWAGSIDDVVGTLGLAPDENEAPFLNSWGTDYPRVVWMPLTVLERLLHEDGEFGVVTDR